MFDAYIVCGTPRTGSTLLCKHLASAGTSGDPHSFYRRQDVAEWAEGWKLQVRDTMGELEFNAAYLDAAITAGKGGTDIFGLRLMRENLDELSAILDQIFPGLASDTARFQDSFGGVLSIHLSREDTARAGKPSLIKAQQAGLWHIAPDGTEIERVAPAQEPHYDFGQIKGELAKLEAYDAAWNIWFAAQGLTPLRIGYKEYFRRPGGGLLLHSARPSAFKPPNAEAVQPGVAKPADETSLDWMRRYRRCASRLSDEQRNRRKAATPSAASTVPVAHGGHLGYRRQHGRI